MSDNMSRDEWIEIQERLQRSYAEKMQAILSSALEIATPARDADTERQATRLWLSGLAMQGFCSSLGVRVSTQAIAEQSWKTADALLAELERTA